MRVDFDEIIADSRGKWLDIFRQLGIEIREDGKHGTCPICGREKHFRVDDKDGSGSWICTCSAGKGIMLVKEVLGIEYREAFEAVSKVIGVCKKVLPREKDRITPEKLRKMFDFAKKYTQGDLVDLYLKNRGISARPEQNVWCARRVWEPETKKEQHAMLCVFSMPDSTAVCVHRTYLDADGNKLKINSPKKMSPAIVERISGGAIRLFDISESETLGIAEGVETALAASGEMNIPFWATYSAAMMCKFVPPDLIKNIMVVGDNDTSFTGQAAAYATAKRLKLKYKKNVEVYIPAKPGDDFLDEIISK